MKASIILKTLRRDDVYNVETFINTLFNESGKNMDSPIAIQTQRSENANGDCKNREITLTYHDPLGDITGLFNVTDHEKDS